MSMESIKKKIPGVLVCLVIAAPCWLLGKAIPVVGGPVFAILAGMIITLFWKNKEAVQPGIAYTSKKILQYAVILLGFGLNLSEIAKVGSRLSAYYRLHHRHLADHCLCTVQADENARPHFHSGGGGLLHLRRVRHRGHRPRHRRGR